MRVERRGPTGIWGRRLVAVPVVFIVTAVLLALVPVVLALTLVADAVRRRRLATTRVALWLLAGLVLECGGLLAALGVWVGSGFGLASGAFRRWSERLRVIWGAALFRVSTRLMDVHVRVEGLEAITPDPAIMFMRHTSVVDTMAPADLIARPLRIRLRYVMKRELLWDPGINVMGTRTPNCFVRRGAGGESRFVGMLADDLGPSDAVLIYPEGMVVTPAKAAAMAARAAARGDGPRAEPYERVHPPRLGGPLALLESAGGRFDVVFIGHVGFEVAPGVRQLLRGDLIGARVRFRIWRVPASSIPGSRTGMADWLHERWHEMDAWVANVQDELGVRDAASALTTGASAR